MQLSKNFFLSEFMVSQTAERLGIPNVPSVEEITNLEKLCKNVLQPFRDVISAPVIISSGFRCDRLNRLIGGAKNSQHTKGQAADLVIPGMSIKDAYELLVAKFPFDQAILEFNSWIHVSYVDHNIRNNRYEKLIALNEGGRTVYKTYNN